MRSAGTRAVHSCGAAAERAMSRVKPSRNSALIHAPPHAPLSSSTISTTQTLFSATPSSNPSPTVTISPPPSVSTTTKCSPVGPNEKAKRPTPGQSCGRKFYGGIGINGRKERSRFSVANVATEVNSVEHV